MRSAKWWTLDSPSGSCSSQGSYICTLTCSESYAHSLNSPLGASPDRHLYPRQQNEKPHGAARLSRALCGARHDPPPQQSLCHMLKSKREAACCWVWRGLSPGGRGDSGDGILTLPHMVLAPPLCPLSNSHPLDGFMNAILHPKRQNLGLLGGFESTSPHSPPPIVSESETD